MTDFALLGAAVAALVFFGASFLRPGVFTSLMMGLKGDYKDRCREHIRMKLTHVLDRREYCQDIRQETRIRWFEPGQTTSDDQDRWPLLCARRSPHVMIPGRCPEVLAILSTVDGCRLEWRREWKQGRVAANKQDKNPRASASWQPILDVGRVELAVPLATVSF